MREIEAPRTTEALAAALHKQHGEVAGYFASMDAKDFVTPQGEYWSPEDHLRHLVICVRPLARALAMPKLALLLRFGPRLGKGGSGPSRSFEEVRDVYRGALAAGGQAGSFTPRPRSEELSPEEARQDVLKRWKKATGDLESAIVPWGEGSLDRLRLPHPLLGKLTVREMLLWNLYHTHHHLSRVQERAAVATPV